MRSIAGVQVRALVCHFEAVEAPVFVTETQWLDAFTRWLHALQARLGQQKVSRKFMVRRRLSSDAGAEEESEAQGATPHGASDVLLTGISMGRCWGRAHMERSMPCSIGP